MDVEFWIGCHCAWLVPNRAWQCGIDSDGDLAIVTSKLKGS